MATTAPPSLNILEQVVQIDILLVPALAQSQLESILEAPVAFWRVEGMMLPPELEGAAQ